MADPLSALSSAIAVGRKLMEVSKKIKDADTRNLIADLNLNLADLKMRVAELQNENTGLKSEVGRLKSSTAGPPRMIHRNGVAYLAEPTGGKSEGPYCPRYIEVVGKPILLSDVPRDMRDLARYICSNCQGTFGAT